MNARNVTRKMHEINSLQRHNYQNSEGLCLEGTPLVGLS